MFRRFHIPKGPRDYGLIWILCYEDSLVRSSSSPKGAMFRTSIFQKSPLPHTGSILRRSFSPKFPPVLRLLCSEDSIFRTSPVVYGFCVTKVLPDDILIFRGTKYYNTGTVYLFCYTFFIFFISKYIYTGYNQSVKLFYLGALSKT